MRTKSSRPRATKQINSKLEKNLATYLAAASAACASMAAAQPAEGKVVYTSTYHVLSNTYYLDVNHDGHVDFVINSFGGCSIREGYSLCLRFLSRIGSGSGSQNNFLGGKGFAQALRAGAKIGPSALFDASAIVGSQTKRGFSGTTFLPSFLGPFANGGKGVRDRYLGLEFYIGSQVHYGWARISVNIKNPKERTFTAIITGYAYETEPGTAIIAGQESGSSELRSSLPDTTSPQSPAATLGMLARGADALSIWRRD
jgi:hypothetical protein